MEQRSLTAFVLADQSVHNAEHHFVRDGGHVVDFRQGDDEAVARRLEPSGVIHRAQRHAVQVAANTREVVVQQRWDANHLGDALGEEGRDVGLAPGSIVLHPELQITPHQAAHHGVFVKHLRIVSRLQAPFHPHAKSIRQLVKAR